MSNSFGGADGGIDRSDLNAADLIGRNTNAVGQLLLRQPVLQAYLPEVSAKGINKFLVSNIVHMTKVGNLKIQIHHMYVENDLYLIHANPERE